MAGSGCETRMQRQNSPNLGGRTVVITRPAGTAASLARKVRTYNGVPMLLPGLSLRGASDLAAARDVLAQALADDLLIFSSPAAAAFAAALLPLRSSANVLAVGQGTAAALRRHGVRAPLAPSQQDSEGLLDLPALRAVAGKRIALIGAPGGRGLLGEQLAARGAHLRDVHVYRRMPPRLDRRHADALLRLPASALILLSSAQALSHLCRLLPAPALVRLRAATAVVSSERLAAAAGEAGFARIIRATSALPADLLDAAMRGG
jgi:uroporphyrinogen-III synthase